MKSERWWRYCRSVAYFDLPDGIAAGLDPERLVGLARELRADVIGLRAGGVSAWYRTEVQLHYPALPDGAPDFLENLIANAREHDLRVVAGVDFGEAGEETLRLRPEWFVRDDREQARALGDGRYQVCPIADFRGEAVAVPVMRELAGYGLDGIIIHSTGASECRCGACKRKFRQAAGKDLPPSGDEGSPAFREWRHWLGTVASAALGSQIQALGEDGSRPVVVVEMVGPAATPRGRTGLAPGDLHRQGDVLLIRNPAEPDLATPAPWVHGVRTRHGLALSPEQAVWVEMPKVPPAGDGTQDIADSGISILAAGGALWNRFSRLLEADDAVLSVLAGLAEHAENTRSRLGGAVDQAPVTLVWPDGADDVVGDVSQSAREEFFGFARAFVNHGVPFAVLPGHLLEVDRLESYQAVVLPSATDLSDRQVHAIRRFVGAGGGLLATFTTGLSDPAGNERRQWDLADMVSAAFEGHILELGGDYVAVPADHDWLKAGLPSEFEIPAERRQVILRPTEGRYVLMEFEFRGEAGALKTGIPFLLGSADDRVLLCSGQVGRVVWEGGGAGVGRLVVNAVRRALGKEIEVGLRTALNVELRILRDGTSVFAYLQRHGDGEDGETDVAVGVTIHEDARPLEAHLIAAGSPAQLELAEGCAWAIIPELKGWELVEFVFPD